MAKVKHTPPFLDRLKSALVGDLKGSGIRAEVRAEPVPTTKLYRVAVLAPKFKVMAHSERQNFVWRIAERALSPDELLRISMILTLTPDEFEPSRTGQRAIKAVKSRGWTVVGSPAKRGNRQAG